MGIDCSVDQIILKHKDHPFMLQSLVVECFYVNVLINGLTYLLSQVFILEDVLEL